MLLSFGGVVGKMGLSGGWETAFARVIEAVIALSG